MNPAEFLPWHWLVLTLLCVTIEGFYSMQEMAVLSFNRLELVYDCARGSKRAQWIAKLLRNPDRLFTTTLLTVNLVLQLGSECSRRFYQSLELSSSIAPLTQVILVIICAELAPTLAGRLHARSVALFGAPILYATSVVLRPAVAVVAWLSDRLNRMMGHSQENFTMISREDLKSIVRRIEPHQGGGGPESFLEKVGNNIFSMEEVFIKDVARPLHACPVISSKASINELRHLFDKERSDYALVIDPQTKRSVGIVLPRFLFDPNIRSYTHVLSLAKPTLIAKESDNLMKLILPLRQSRYSIAIILGADGLPMGALSFDEVAHYLFGAHHGHAEHTSGMLVDRTFDPKTTLGLLRHSWSLEFGLPDEWTLERFLNHAFERRPEPGEKYIHRGMELEWIAPPAKDECVRIRSFVQG